MADSTNINCCSSPLVSRDEATFVPSPKRNMGIADGISNNPIRHNQPQRYVQPAMPKPAQANNNIFGKPTQPLGRPIIYRCWK